MKMPRAYPTWSRMWMIPNFFSHLERKEKATYLTVLWKGRLFVEFDSFCRSENACEIDEIFLFLETTIEILSFVSWVPECLNEQRFCISQKEKSQNIVEKDKKKFIWTEKSNYNNAALQWRFISCAQSATDFYNGKSAHISSDWLSRTLLILFLLYNLL